MDSDRCDLPRWHGTRHRHRFGEGSGRYWSTLSTRRHTYDTDQPWVTYLYITTDRRTRFTGRSHIRCECIACGKAKTLSIRIPRIGPVPLPESGKHPQRERFLVEHAPCGLRSRADWAKPLANPFATGGLDLSMLENIARTAQMEAAEQERTAGGSGTAGDTK